ncbi:hypothetical protein A9Q83_05995 [Alphaproteobacteria bacterium 46_93_T64]|nr:hypothetical protein A9Q83_05995 [Alphaproteobacteria bacterium 46_93_T64]
MPVAKEDQYKFWNKINQLPNKRLVLTISVLTILLEYKKINIFALRAISIYVVRETFTDFRNRTERKSE